MELIDYTNKWVAGEKPDECDDQLQRRLPSVQFLY